jgi:hypothetical protein
MRLRGSALDVEGVEIRQAQKEPRGRAGSRSRLHSYLPVNTVPVDKDVHVRQHLDTELADQEGDVGDGSAEEERMRVLWCEFLRVSVR